MAGRTTSTNDARRLSGGITRKVSNCNALQLEDVERRARRPELFLRGPYNASACNFNMSATSAKL